MRISSVLANVLVTVLIYSFTVKQYGKNFGLVVASLSSCLFLAVYYGHLSRGYVLVDLFFAGALFSAFKIIQNDRRNLYWLCFCFSSVLGFYAVPSFLYAFIMLDVLVLLLSAKSCFRLLYCNVITLALVTLLYLPVILVNGLKALISNPVVVPINRLEVLQQLPSFLKTSLSEITGLPWLLVAALLFISFILLVKQNDHVKLAICGVFVYVRLYCLSYIR